jgi:hypothetical protein
MPFPPQLFVMFEELCEEYQIYACGNFFTCLDLKTNCYSRTVFHVTEKK